MQKKVVYSFEYEFTDFDAALDEIKKITAEIDEIEIEVTFKERLSFFTINKVFESVERFMKYAEAIKVLAEHGDVHSVEITVYLKQT